MTAIECDRDGSLTKQIVQTDDPSAFVGQKEGGHRLADFRRARSRVAFGKPADHLIDRCAEIRTQTPEPVDEGLQTVGQWRVQSAAADVEILEDRAEFRLSHQPAFLSCSGAAT